MTAQNPSSRDYLQTADQQRTNRFFVADLLHGPGVACLFVDGDPNGTYNGQFGQLAMDTTTGTLYQNTDGNTAWAVFATGNADSNVFNVKAYGARGDGISDDAPAIRAAMAAANAASGGIVFFPAGTYMVSKDAGNPWCLAIPGDNITLLGAGPRLSTVKAMAALPAPPVGLIYANRVAAPQVKELGVNGNWGAVIGVNPPAGAVIPDGINQLNQADPKNHLLIFRGCDDVVVENVYAAQSYGDMVWLGYSTAPDDTLDGCTRVALRNIVGDTSARNGITLGQRCSDVVVENCYMLNGTMFAQAFDTEPQGVDQPCRDVHVSNSVFGLWWDTGAPRTQNSSFAIVGGDTTAMGQENAARGYRVERCTIYGSMAIASAIDVVVRDNRFICDFAGNSVAPVFVNHTSDDVSILDNYIYDRSANPAAGAHDASIMVEVYGVGFIAYQPAGVRVCGNRIKSRNGRSGIKAIGTGGGSSNIATGLQAPVAGVATATGAASLTDGGAAWAGNQFAGWTVRRGTAHGTVITNDPTTLTTTGWYDVLGNPVADPGVGAYAIDQLRGVLAIEGNSIDCTDDGNGGGANGIELQMDTAGMRVRVARNQIRNANSVGVNIIPGVAANPALALEIVDNIGWDDQLVATFSYLVRVPDPSYVTKLVVRGNINNGAAFPLPFIGQAAGAVPGVWLVEDGVPQRWTGYGVPAMAAPDGSTYARLDGAALTTLYARVAGAWVAYA